MADLSGPGKVGGELDPIPPPPLTIPPNVKPEVLISPKYCITARRGAGTTGRRIQLLANHFKITVKARDAVFDQYSVHITAEDKREVEGKGIGRKLVDRLFQTYPSELAGKKFAYDGEKALNTVGPLPQNKLEFTFVLEETFAKSETVSPIDGPEKRSRRTSQSKAFTVELSYAAKIPLKSIALALKGANVENTQDALRVLDIILRQQAANMGCLLVRQSFFHDDSRNFTDVGEGVISVLKRILRRLHEFLDQIDVVPVWNAWGHALIRMEHYAQARVMLVCLVLLLIFPCVTASDEENQDLMAAQVLKLTAEAELLNAQAVQLRQWNEELEPGNMFLTGLLIIGLVVCGHVAWWAFTWIRLIGKYYWSRWSRRNLRKRELEQAQAEEV